RGLVRGGSGGLRSLNSAPCECEVDRFLERQPRAGSELCRKPLRRKRKTQRRECSSLELLALVVLGRAEIRLQPFDAAEQARGRTGIAGLGFICGDAEHRPELSLNEADLL